MITCKTSLFHSCQSRKCSTFVSYSFTYLIFMILENRDLYFTHISKELPKESNEVCSFLFDYLNAIPEEVKEFHVFSDACGGQNRNHTVTRLLLAMAMNNRFSVIHQYFPVRGHSFIPCDRNFSVIKRSVRRFD